MILIADSGSTKTTWMWVGANNDSPVQADKVVTEGLNPHFTTDEVFLAACAAVRQHFPLSSFHFPLHFYGAGCGNAAQSKRVKALLQKAFGSMQVEVETDMLGACRATAGDKPALVGILGTGSNACLYDGHRIRYKPFSTGYILGDTGSANHVGRLLLNDYLTHRMPGKLRHLFHETYRMSDAKFIDAVYHQPNPNRFLASLAVFAAKHQEEDYCNGVIGDAISFWYFEVLKPLYWHRSYFPDTEWDGSVHLVGGFAKAIEPQLKVLFEEGPLSLVSVVADPIEGLRRFHTI